MGCCGDRRDRASSAGRSVIFAWEGTGRVVVRGSATGRSYTFESKGSRMSVDLRDQDSIVRIMPAVLRKVE